MKGYIETVEQVDEKSYENGELVVNKIEKVVLTEMYFRETDLQECYIAGGYIIVFLNNRLYNLIYSDELYEKMLKAYKEK